MERRVIPSNLHFAQARSDISALNDGTLQVVDSNTEWEGGFVGVNSFGFGGSNVHVILKSCDVRDVGSRRGDEEKMRLVLMSGRSKEVRGFFTNRFAKNIKIILPYLL